MFELFRQEAENQTATLTRGILTLEQNPTSPRELEALMRAAHSLKGAARIIGLEAGVRLAHAMEDCFVAAQKGQLLLNSAATDCLLRSVDLFTNLAQTPESNLAVWDGNRKSEVDSLVQSLAALTSGSSPSLPARMNEAPLPVPAENPPIPPAPAMRNNTPEPEAADRVLRVTAENLNRLLGLAGESLVESRWLEPFADSLLRLKRQQWRLAKTLESLEGNLAGQSLDERTQAHLQDAQQQAGDCLRNLSTQHAEFELYCRRIAGLSHRLYREAMASRMRPFADGVHGFPRLVRDLARDLGKDVRLEITGKDTPLDREVLEKLEAPLNHLLRNAVDHGIEMPEVRVQTGKPPQGTILLEARHSAGLLLIIVQDDGCGISLERLRKVIGERKLAAPEVVEKLGEDELLEFLFLPGFSLRENVTNVSGRGVGLDVVRSTVQNLRGSVRVSAPPGQGVRFQLQLPLTVSVARTLLAEIAGEPYAFPLARVQGVLRVPQNQVAMLEGREHLAYKDQRIGLVAASQILGRGAAPAGDELAVIVLGERTRRFGVVVDKFLGERELVVQPLDPRLRKIKDISAAALMPDGSPVLIVDVDDLLRSIELLVTGGRLAKAHSSETALAQHRCKRILVVDDSLTVRELERKLLSNRGFEVEVAVDGMDGWNAVRTETYDLVVSDVDMPRLDGIELVSLIKKDPRLKALPVMIVSYKDREEDRRRGLDAGADYYLTKGSFHDEALLTAVVDLIGEPEDHP
ncbi:MAG: hybrid sensor histidine kinase/response regulator [Verrucomicrobiota bacterium]